jgi:predicted CXXCH cytochrome family protein
MRLCLECHSKTITKADGSKIESVASMMAKGQHLHGPIASGNCSGCHDVHGGTHRALLVKPYSESFYQPFDTAAYALCFGCHKQALATEPKTSSDTQFRNGEVNLHYVHVVAPGATGRSCRACHATHSAPNERQVRAATEFGQWKIPLNLELSATGGSCGAGCHRARSYDRVNPVAYEPKPAP